MASGFIGTKDVARIVGSCVFFMIRCYFLQRLQRPATDNMQDTTPTKESQFMDPYDARIIASGCAAEHVKLYDCHWEHKDFRKCIKEMQEFKECWKRTHKQDS